MVKEYRRLECPDCDMPYQVLTGECACCDEEIYVLYCEDCEYTEPIHTGAPERVFEDVQ